MPFALHSERGPPTLPGQGHGNRDWARPKISDYTGALLTRSCPKIRARDVEMNSLFFVSIPLQRHELQIVIIAAICIWSNNRMQILSVRSSINAFAIHNHNSSCIQMPRLYVQFV